ncbi:MAG: hypothetical protein R3C30_07055 [Hyphomonadaceae bacterium]
MPLRHGKGPAPAWADGCAGPFLVIFCGLGLLSFAFAGVHSFNDGAAVVAMIILSVAGIFMTIDYFGDHSGKHEK